jgi:hypothetical protein
MGLTYALFRFVVIADKTSEKFSYYNYVIKRGTVFNIILITVIIVVNFVYPHPEEFALANGCCRFCC